MIYTVTRDKNTPLPGYPGSGVLTCFKKIFSKLLFFPHDSDDKADDHNHGSEQVRIVDIDIKQYAADRRAKPSSLPIYPAAVFRHCRKQG